MHHPEVEIIETGREPALGRRQQRGPAPACATRVSRGYILLLNNDTIVPEGSLRRLVEALERRSRGLGRHAAHLLRPRSGAGLVRRGRGRPLERLDPPRGHPPADRASSTPRSPLRGLRHRLRAAAGAPGASTGSACWTRTSTSTARMRTTPCASRAAGGRILHVPAALVLHKVSASVGGPEPAQGLAAQPQPRPSAAQALAAPALAGADR